MQKTLTNSKDGGSSVHFNWSFLLLSPSLFLKTLNDSADTWHDKMKVILQIAQKNTIRQDLMFSVRKNKCNKMLSPSNCAFDKTIKIACFDCWQLIPNNINLHCKKMSPGGKISSRFAVLWFSRLRISQQTGKRVQEPEMRSDTRFVSKKSNFNQICWFSNANNVFNFQHEIWKWDMHVFKSTNATSLAHTKKAPLIAKFV